MDLGKNNDMDVKIMKSTTTIWIITGVMNAGGAESLIMNMLRYKYDNICYKLIVHGAKDGEIGIHDEEIRALGIDIHYLPAVGAVGEKAYSKAFNNLITEIGKPDIIHSHLNAVGGIIARVAKKAGIKHRIVHCHADIHFTGNFLSKIINEVKLQIMRIYVNLFATDYFACSESAAKRLFYNHKKAIIINNAISVEQYLCTPEKYNAARASLGIDENALVIGAVGRITRIKNYETILKALTKLKQDKINAVFVCYGRAADKDYYNELFEECHKLNIVDNVKFMGNSSDIHTDIAAFDIFVLPSFTEGLGIVALEAQAAGKHCLLSTGVPPKADVGLGLVEYINPNDYESWATKIKTHKTKEIEHNEILAAFSEAGFNASTEIQHIETCYFNITGEH